MAEIYLLYLQVYQSDHSGRKLKRHTPEIAELSMLYTGVLADMNPFYTSSSLDGSKIGDGCHIMYFRLRASPWN